MTKRYFLPAEHDPLTWYFIVEPSPTCEAAQRITPVRHGGYLAADYELSDAIVGSALAGPCYIEATEPPAGGPP